MYAKVFASLWNGTLCGQTHPQLVFIYLLAHADLDGSADIHPRRIALDCGLSQDQVEKATKILEGPDPESRSPELGGARLELIDSHRSWGWMIVNYSKYRTMQDGDTVRAQTKERVAQHRKKRSVTVGNGPVTDGNGQKRHVDVDVEVDKDSPFPTSTEQSISEDAEFSLPTSRGTERPLSDREVSEFIRLYPAVDVAGELRAMRGWLMSNPTRRKTPRGMMRFVNAWLSRCQDRGPVDSQAEGLDLSRARRILEGLEGEKAHKH